MLLSPTDLVEIEREYCRRSLANFAKRAWPVLEPGTALKWGWVLDLICDHLEAVTNGQSIQLLINVPPGSMKSLLTGVIWPAWEWGPRGNQGFRYLATAHKQDLAVRDNMKCRRLIQSAWYQKHWPVNLVGDQNQKTKFENDATGFREAMAFTSMTGSRGDRVILDDPHSVDDANSPVKLQADMMTFREALPTRVNNDKSAIVIIMQRLNQGDVAGRAIEMGYDHLCIPMRYEDGHSKWVFGNGDPRTVEGELMFPDRFPLEQVAKLEAEMGSYAVAGQLQQRPVPREGGMFKRHWFNPLLAAPTGTRWVRGWDLAASTKSDSPWTAGIKIGRTPEGRFIVGDVRRERVNTPRAIIRNTANNEPDVFISYPQDPGQAGKDQARSIAQDLAGFKFRSSPESGDKATRAEPFAAQCEAGNVDILPGDWNTAFLDEICAFPFGKFMDQVDAASRAFNELAKPQGSSKTRAVKGF